MIDREQKTGAMREGLPMDGGASGSGLTSGPTVAGGSTAFQRSVQMNLELNAQTRKN